MSDIEAPSPIYLAARNEWDERYGSHISRAKQWRLMAFGLLCTTGISTGAAVWLAAQSHVVPYVVERDKLGEEVAVHQVAPAPPADAGQIKAQLARWIVDTRSVYTDPFAEKAIGTEAMAWVDRDSDALSQIETWFRAHPPNTRALKETVGVSIESVGQVGGNTWSVDWAEDHRTKDGFAPVTSFWRATIRIKVSPPTDDASIRANPGGIYVVWFSVTPRIR